MVGACDFFPNGEETAGGDDGLAVGVGGVAFVAAPSEAHVVRGAHLGAFGEPEELVLFGVPVGLGGDGAAAEDGGLAVGKSDGVVGEEGGEGFAAAELDGLLELAFELHELDLTGRKGGDDGGGDDAVGGLGGGAGDDAGERLGVEQDRGKGDGENEEGGAQHGEMVANPARLVCSAAMRDTAVERGLIAAAVVLFGLSAVFAAHGVGAVALRVLGCVALGGDGGKAADADAVDFCGDGSGGGGGVRRAGGWR